MFYLWWALMCVVVVLGIVALIGFFALFNMLIDFILERIPQKVKDILEGAMIIFTLIVLISMIMAAGYQLTNWLVGG